MSDKDNFLNKWIEGIPKNWKTTKLKYLSELKASSVDRNYSENKTTVSICHYPQAYHNEKINSTTSLSVGTCTDYEIENFSLEKGQIILTKDSESPNDIGVPSFIAENIKNAVCGYHLILISSNHNLINPEFLFRYLQSRQVRSYFAINSNGVTRFGLPKNTILNLLICVPPRDEQDKIVIKLNNSIKLVDNLIRKKKNIIDLLNEKRKSKVIELVTKGIRNKDFVESNIDWIGLVPITWELKKLKYIFSIKKVIANELGHEVLSVTQKGIKIKDIKSNKGQQSLNYSKYQKVDRGDFIMNHMDLISGSIDISPYDGVTSPDYRVFTIRDQDYDPRYFLHIFQFCYSNKIFFGLGQGVSQLGRWRMSAGQFNNFIVPCPSIKEQVLIADYLDKITKTTNEAVSKKLLVIEKLQEYRTSIISDTVTGRRQ